MCVCVWYDIMKKITFLKKHTDKTSCPKPTSEWLIYSLLIYPSTSVIYISIYVWILFHGLPVPLVTVYPTTSTKHLHFCDYGKSLFKQVPPPVLLVMNLPFVLCNFGISFPGFPKNSVGILIAFAFKQ